MNLSIYTAVVILTLTVVLTSSPGEALTCHDTCLELPGKTCSEADKKCTGKFCASTILAGKVTLQNCVRIGKEGCTGSDNNKICLCKKDLCNNDNNLFTSSGGVVRSTTVFAMVAIITYLLV